MSVPDVRTGLGWDSHRIVPATPDRPLVLGGVVIPGDVALDGHSDADVLAHAITDALLGGIGAGDIGEHFPDDDERWRGADSMDLLAHVVGLVGAAGFVVTSVDATVVLERPRLRDHKRAMVARLAGVLGIDGDRVNVKATTAERMDAAGRGEGAVAMAVATVVRGAPTGAGPG